MYVEYSSNNSGGHWWLEDDDWKKLEAAGWKVGWASLEHLHEDGECVRDDDGTPKFVPLGQGGSQLAAHFSRRDPDGTYRRLGALATCAYRVGVSLREAAAEWEHVTGKSSTDAGCPCCGNPHNFTEYDDNGRYVASGP